MLIYVIPAWYPKDEKDTITACFIREQVHALKKRGHTIVVIFFQRYSLRELHKYLKYKNHVWNDNGVITKYHKVFTLAPMRFEKLYHRNVSNKYYKFIKKTYKEAESIYGCFNQQIIHCHIGQWAGYFCIKAAKKLHVPIVVTEHSSALINGSKNDLQFIREKYVIENADATIFVGSNMRNYVLDVTKAKGNTVVIPNQINVELFKAIREKKRRPFKFLVAGRLVWLKKIKNVIIAFHNEFNKDEDVELLIAGEGEERDNLEQLVKELGEEQRISFYGKYDREDVSSLFSGCDAFVLTSVLETFGIVYLEAMICGLPCIGTKGQGSDDIITDSNGLSVNCGDISDLQKAMRIIYENIDKYDPNIIRKYVIDHFSEEAVCKQIEYLYSKLLNYK